MELFRLFGTVMIKDEASGSLDSIDKKAKNTSGTLGNLSKSFISGMGAFAGAKVLDGVINGLQSATKMGWSFNNNIEQAKTNFTTFLGSAEQANKLLTDLQEIAKNTPFELGDLTKSTQMLINYGSSAEESKKQLLMLGDIAMGDAEKLSGLTMAFGQIQSTGKLTGEDLNQLIERGFNPLKIISQQTGASMGDLKEKMSDGEISFKMVSDAMQVATSSGGQFFNSMNNSSKTMEGQVSTLKDNLSTTFGQILAPLFNYISTTILPQLNGSFGTLTSSVGVYIPIIVNNIMNLFNIFNSYLMPVIQSFMSYIIPLLPTLQSLFVSTFNMISSVVMALVPSILYLAQNILPILANMFTWICKNIIPPVIEIFNYLSGTIIPMIAKAFSQWMPVVVSTLSDTWIVVKSILDRLLAIFNFVFPTIKAVVTSVISSVTNQITYLINILSGLMMFLSGVFTGNWSKAWQGIVKIFGGIWDSLKNMVKTPFNAMIAVVNSGISKLNKLSFTLPGVMGGGKVGLNVSSIPYLAKGGIIEQAGDVIVGEKGAERLTLPKGAKVEPLNKSNGTVVNINNPTLLNNEAIDDIMNIVVKRLRLEGAY